MTKNKLNNNSNTEIADYTADVKMLTQEFKSSLCFDSEVQKWYKYNGTYWKKLSNEDINEIITDYFCENELKFDSTISLRSLNSFISQCLKRLKYRLKVDDSMKIFPFGINFKNGYFVPATKKVLPHTPLRFVTKMVDFLYDPTQSLNKEMVTYILQLCNYDTHNINLLRSLISRCLLPRPELETAYLLHGPFKTEKYTFVKFLLKVLGTNRSVKKTFKELSSLSSIAELENKFLYVFREITKFRELEAEWLERITGRESFRIKFTQTTKNVTPEGVLLMTSNYSPDDLFSVSHTILDRVYLIHFHKVVKNSDENLLEKLLDNGNRLIYWSISMPNDHLEKLEKVDDINVILAAETNIVVDWIIKTFSIDRDGYILKKDLFPNFLEYLKKVKHNYKYAKTNFYSNFYETCNKIFGIKMSDSRKKVTDKTIQTTPRVVVGLKFKENGDPSLETKLKEARFYQNPFEGAILEEDAIVYLNDFDFEEKKTFEQKKIKRTKS